MGLIVCPMPSLSAILGLILLLSSFVAHAQELQPRRWSHLPMGSNFAGAVYGYTSADIFFSPSTRIEDATLDLHSVAASYTHSFNLFGKSARFDLVQGYQYGRWEGLLNGAQASTSRTGLTDTLARLSVILYGAPPLTGQDFVAYRKEVRDCETLIGAGFAVSLPTGKYLKDRLINIGSNRYVFMPQVGVQHNRGPWTYELTTGLRIFTDNNSFYGGQTLEQDPLFTGQAHLIYTFRPGLWCGVGAALGGAGTSVLNGTELDDSKNNFLWGASVGFSITRTFGLKLTYVSARSLERAGADSHSFLFGGSIMW